MPCRPVFRRAKSEEHSGNIVGAIVGGVICSKLFGLGVTGLNITSLIVAVIGSVVVLVVLVVVLVVVVVGVVVVVLDVVVAFKVAEREPEAVLYGCLLGIFLCIRRHGRCGQFAVFQAARGKHDA